MIPPGRTFTIPAGMHLEFNTGRHLINRGQLHFNGTDAAPITLTSAQVSKQGNDWPGIVTQGPGTTTNANYTVVEYAQNAFSFTEGASGTLDHATLRHNQNGLWVSGGLAHNDPTQDSRPVMHHSNLYDNSNYHYYAANFADATVTLDAQTNWWGSTDAARIERDIYDQQDDANSPVIDWQSTLLNDPTAPLPHALHITQPLSGIVTAETAITIRGTFDAQLSSRFTVNGYGVNLQGNSFSATVPLSVGGNAITAKAESPQGQIAEDVITVTRIEQNTVTLSATPDRGYDPLDVSFTVNNQSGNSIQSIAMDYNGDGLIDETITTTNSFSHLYTDGGHYTATAYITDSSNATYLATTPIQVQRSADVPLLSDLSITSPVDVASIDGDTILIQGSYAGPDTVTITLNGRPVLYCEGRWYVNNVHLAPGSNILIAKAVTDDGQTAQKTIAVTSTATSPITVAADRYTGLVPLSVNLTINNPRNISLAHVSVDFDTDGTLEIDTADLTTPLSHSYDTQGDAVATISITDAEDRVQVNKLAIVAEQSVEQLDAQLRGIFNGMMDRLRVNDIPGALVFIGGSSRSRYEKLFTILGDSLPAAVDALGVLSHGTIGKSYAEYTIVREKSGIKYAYPVLFLRSGDGAWRIESM